MHCRIIDFHQAAQVRGVAVVVDVLRACSTAALATVAGAEAIDLAFALGLDTVDVALVLRERPGARALVPI